MKLNKYEWIVFFGGGDINYHNKGHFDMKIMEVLSVEHKVLWINSIGMRVPSIKEKKNFFKKIARKFKSFMKGFVRHNENQYSYSPLYIPGPVGHFFTKHFLYLQLKIVMWQLGIVKPLIWVVTPTSVDVAKKISNDIVYQRTDKNEELEGASREFIKDNILKLKESSKLTVYCSPILFQEEKKQWSEAVYVPHGLSNVFMRKDNYKKIDLPGAGKCVLFVGAIDEHTFDIKLFKYVVENNPDYRFVMVGDVTFDTCLVDKFDNVFFLGRKDQDVIPQYLCSADILAMYWNNSEWIKYCSPIKYLEYLTSGKPIVTMPFSNVLCSDADNGVFVAKNDIEFANLLRGVDVNSYDRKMHVHENSWNARVEVVIREINENF